MNIKPARLFSVLAIVSTLLLTACATEKVVTETVLQPYTDTETVTNTETIEVPGEAVTVTQTAPAVVSTVTRTAPPVVTTVTTTWTAPPDVITATITEYVPPVTLTEIVYTTIYIN